MWWRRRPGGHATVVVSAVLVLTGILVACSSSKESAMSDDELGRASYLIDHRQYSEAIYILGDRIRRNSGDTKARILLASAYAARAGLSFTSYSDFAAELGKWQRVDELLPTDNDSFILQGLAKALVRLQLVIRAFQAVPVPPDVSSATDIRTGLQTLIDAGTLHGGASLYRALLRIVIFKQATVIEARPSVEKGCLARVGDIAVWIKKMGGDLEMIFQDVAAGLAEGPNRDRVLQFAQEIRVNLNDPRLASVNLNQDANSRMKLPTQLKSLFGACE